MIKVVYYKCSCGHHGEDRYEGQWNNQCSICGKLQGFYKIKYNPVDIQQSGTCNVDSMMVNHPRYSAALGVLDEGLAKARLLHPQAEWKRFGNSWRPLINNRSEKLKMMKQADYFEY